MRFPSRVLMTADTVGGVWTYAIELARALGQQGTRVCLATMGRPVSYEQGEQARSIPTLELRESSYKLEWMSDPWQDVDASGDWLLGLENEFKPEIVHLNGYAHASLPWRTPTVVVAHSCVYSWWSAVRRSEAPAEWREYRDRVTSGLRAADVRVAVSKFMSTEVRRWYGETGQIDVIYNAREASQYVPSEKENFVLSCGRVWDDAKNISALDRAAAAARWPVVVAGEEQHPEGGQARLTNSHPLGAVPPDELRSWYSRASIYALPARYEPFGLSALEAGLAGCALVLGDTPSLREVWQTSALFVPPDDSEAVAIAINALVHNQAMREDLGARARARAIDFSPARMLELYLRAYERASSAFASRHGGTQAAASCE